MDTLEWPECTWDQAIVGLVVCTVNPSGQPCKPCVLCEIGLAIDRHSPLFYIFIVVEGLQN